MNTPMLPMVDPRLRVTSLYDLPIANRLLMSCPFETEEGHDIPLIFSELASQEADLKVRGHSLYQDPSLEAQL